MKFIMIMVLSLAVLMISYFTIDIASSMMTNVSIYETTVTGLHHYHQDGFTMVDANNCIIMIPDSDSYCISLEGHSQYCSNYEEITKFNIGDHVKIASSMSIFGIEHVKSAQKIKLNQK